MNLTDHLAKRLQERFRDREKLHPSETAAIQRFQSEFLFKASTYGGLSGTAAYMFTRNLIKPRGPRMLAVLSVGTLGAYLGMQDASRHFIVNFYSIPDSPIAQEGREYIRQNAPNSPLLQRIESNMKVAKSRRNSTSNPTFEGSSEEVTFKNLDSIATGASATTSGSRSDSDMPPSLDYYFDPEKTKVAEAIIPT